LISGKKTFVQEDFETSSIIRRNETQNGFRKEAVPKIVD
jgi:hypothetical protein